MKTKLTLLVISSSLLLAAPALLAQNNLSTNASTIGATNNFTSTSTNAQARTNKAAFKGQQLILATGITEKLKLTDEQKVELKPIEEDFGNISQEYQTANQPRIDAANEAIRQAVASKDPGQIQAARAQLQAVWAVFQPDRAAAIAKIKPLLTPEQIKILEDPKNQ